MTQLRHAESQIRDAGAELVVIGNGAPNFIEGFRDKTGFEGRLYTDPSRKTYRALEFARGLGATLNLKAMRRAIEAYGRGNRQSKPYVVPLGDAWQQGGVAVIARGGEMRYLYRSDHAGDHPRINEILTAARRAAQSAR